MIRDLFTPEVTIALIFLTLGFILGHVLSFMDHITGYDEGWHKGVEDVIDLIELWEE